MKMAMRWSFTRELEELAQLADHLVVTTFLESGRHARREVPFEQRRLECFECTLDRIRLFDDVHAVLVFLDHLADALQVTLNGGQAVQDLFLVALHRLELSSPFLSPPRWGGGSDTVLPVP